MFECTVHVIFRKPVTELVVVHLFPFVIKLREVHHHITLRAVQLGGCTVLVLVAVAVVQVGDGDLPLGSFLAQATPELRQNGRDHAGIDFAGDVLGVALGLVEHDASILDFRIHERNGTAHLVCRERLVCRFGVAGKGIDGYRVSCSGRYFHHDLLAFARTDNRTAAGILDRYGTPGAVRAVIGTDVYRYLFAGIAERHLPFVPADGGEALFLRGCVTAHRSGGHLVCHADRHFYFQRRSLPRQFLRLVGILHRDLCPVQCRVACALVARQGDNRLFLIGGRAAASGDAPVRPAVLDVIKLVEYPVLLVLLIDAALLADGEATRLAAAFRGIGQRVFRRGGFQCRCLGELAAEGGYKALGHFHLLLERAERFIKLLFRPFIAAHLCRLPCGQTVGGKVGVAMLPVGQLGNDFPVRSALEKPYVLNRDGLVFFPFGGRLHDLLIDVNACS